MQKLQVQHGVSYTSRAHIVEGTIKIVNSPGDVSKVKSGDIIVVPSMSWGLEDFVAPIMYEKAVAVLAPAASALCHIAILMRELNKPCLAMEEGAIKKLKDGQKARIEVNTLRARLSYPQEEQRGLIQKLEEWIISTLTKVSMTQNAIVVTEKQD